MSKRNPSEITDETLSSLAKFTLCGLHQRQVNNVCHQWKAKIQNYNYLHEHGEWDYHPDRSPVLKAQSELLSDDMISSDEFERHVAHHLEQLALFALPLPMKDSSGVSSNQAAVSGRGDRKIISDAMSSVSIDTEYGKTEALYVAVIADKEEWMMEEIRNGANLTLPYGRYRSVVQAAAANLSWPRRYVILQKLLEYGADANAQSGVYGNALQAVAANPGVFGPRLGAMRILIQSGADVNAPGGKYGYALIAAAATPPSLSESPSSILEFLLDNGANPNAQEPTLYVSALHQAMKNNDDKSVRLLLDRGALTEAARKKDLELKVPLNAVLRIQRNFRRRRDWDPEA